MEIKEVQIGRIKNNEENPRKISDANFAKLVKSIKDMPSMSKIREVVVDENMVTMGGNQRLKAYKEAGFKKLTIKKVSKADFKEELKVDGATWEQIKKEFIVKDNVEFGKWAKELVVEFGFDTSMEDWGVEEGEWKTEEIEFNPNTAPTTSHAVITQEQLDKKEQLLKTAMISETTHKTIACPHCMEEFTIDE